MIPVSSWGRLSADEHRVLEFRDVAEALRRVPAETEYGQALPAGMGRSYGDVSLNAGGILWSTRSLDRMLAFDEAGGLLTVEPGVLLSDIQNTFAPKGWMLPVTPGTQWVTVGGAIANDVHGKNHAAYGSFGEHITSLDLARTDGTVLQCGPRERPDWFSATVGGLGLTGLITRATIRLKRVPGLWLETEDVPFSGVDDFLELSDESDVEWEHTVSWVDVQTHRGRGRGIFTRGNHRAVGREWKQPGEGKLGVPFSPPFSLVNKPSLRAFNSVYYQSKKIMASRGAIHYRPFFYPLDSISDWSRIYGPKGFYQYQSVVPREHGSEATKEMFRVIAASGQGSFLTVLKTFGGRPSVGMLSFPKEGITVALDFPNRGESTLALFKTLDGIVRDAGGRLYPAKDARMSEEMFRSGYPRLDEFDAYRDPGISSEFSRRVMGW